MMKERFFVRFVKSFLYLVCWIFLILILMMVLNQTEMTFADMFTTSNGLWLWVFASVFAALYPFYGYCRRQMSADVTENVDVIDEIASRQSLKRVNDNLNAMEFRASTIVKKLLLQFEDRIMIYTENGESYIEGPRKEVVKLIFRFDTFLISKENK